MHESRARPTSRARAARGSAAAWALSVGVAFLMWGCALPDLKPFAESTARIHAAVLKTEVDLPAMLRESGNDDEAAKLEAHLAVRVQAMNGLLRYSESLAHIADAGSSGSASAGRVGDSLNGLLGVLKAAPLAGQALASVQLAYGYVAQVRAAGAFADAVERADPVLQMIAGILEKDFKALEDLVPQLRPGLQRRVMERTPDIVSLNDYRQGLERQRRRLEKKLAEDPGNAGLIKEAQDNGMLIDQTRDRYEPLVAEQQRIAARIAELILLMKKTREAVAEWAAVHSSLAADVKAGMQPNTAMLVSLAIQIQGLTQGGASK